jgi:curli biogenesis system outer membrane secretion channel CsgG
MVLSKEMRMRGSGEFAVLWLVLMIVGLSSCASPTGPQPTVRATGTVAKASAITTVAVWDMDELSPSSGAQPDLGQALSGRIMEAFESKGKYTLVERQRLILALEELHLGSSELADESTRLRLGNLVGAQAMVFGAYQVIGSSMRLDLRLVDVETGKVLKATQRTVSASDLTTWLKAAREAGEELL